MKLAGGEFGVNLLSNGLIELDGFEVSHTKDAILFQDDEEEELEKFLSVVCPQSKRVDWDKCEQGTGSKSQRVGTDMQVVPWSQIKFILEYWYVPNV